MTTEIQTTGSRDLARVAESLVTKGDLSGLTLEERARHYIATCESHGLNPHSQPFSFLTLNGKLVMYANRGCTDQLAAMHHVNRKIIDGPRLMDLGGTKILAGVFDESLRLVDTARRVYKSYGFLPIDTPARSATPPIFIASLPCSAIRSRAAASMRSTRSRLRCWVGSLRRTVSSDASFII